MAIITPSKVFQPEFLGHTAVEILFKKLSLLNSGFVANAEARGAFALTPNEIKFPKFVEDGALGVQTLPEDGSSVTPDDIEMDFDTEQSVDKIIAYRWTKKTLETALRGNESNPGSVEEFLAQTVARKSQKAIQDSLIAKAIAKTESANMVVEDVSGLPTYAGLLKAGYEKWGEYATDEDQLLIAHSKVVYDILMTDEAQKANLYGAPNTVTSGKIMQIAGKHILPLDSIPTNEDGLYKNIILRRGGLELYMLRDLDFQEQAIANSDAWNSWWTFRFATHVPADLPTPVIQYLVGSSLDA